MNESAKFTYKWTTTEAKLNLFVEFGSLTAPNTRVRTLCPHVSRFAVNWSGETCQLRLYHKNRYLGAGTRQRVVQLTKDDYNNVLASVEFWSRFPNTPTTDEILILGFASEPERK